MEKMDSSAVGGKKGQRGLKGHSAYLIIVIIAVFIAGIIATSAMVEPPLDYILAGILGFCVLALTVFMALEWGHYREQNKGYIEEITDLNLRFGILADAVSAVSSTLDLQELVENILGVMLTLTNSNIGVVLVPGEAAGNLNVLAHRGFVAEAVRGLKIPVGRGGIGRAFQTGQMIIRKDMAEDERAVDTYSDGRSPRSQIIMPLKAKGQMVGVAVTACCDEHDYKPDEIALLSSLGHELAVAMINVDLYQQSQRTLEWLADTQEYTDRFIQEMLAGVLVVNDEGDIMFFNQEAAGILKIEPKEVIGVNYQDLVAEREKFRSMAFIKPIMQLCLEEERPFRRHEITIEGPNARGLTINFNAFPLHIGKGEKMGAAMVFVDITAMKDMEARLRQQDHLSILGQMAAKIAHEVKNPLFAIIGLADELVEEEQDRDRVRLLDMIKEEAALSNQWISGMLSFSKSPFPVGGNRELCLQDELSELIADFVQVNGRDNIKINGDFEPEVPAVLVSPENIRHVLFNLLENAMQAMPEGGVITVRLHDSGNGFVEMRVEDTGCGISDDIKPSIFDPFFTTKDGGTGLGLAIVEKILLDTGGDIEVRSQQDLGTTFILKLPTSGVAHE